MKMKYPRTPHLSWSRPDETDIWMEEEFPPLTQVVVTEKLDGENTSVYRDGTCHARSIDSRSHPSRHMARAKAAEVGPQLSSGYVLLCENMYAKHSISYESLEGYLYVFGARFNDVFLSWEEVEDISKYLGLPTTPLYGKGSGETLNMRMCGQGVALLVRRVKDMLYAT